MAKDKKIIRFGIIGLGLMGREFGSAAARWCHLLDLDFEPQITAICDTNDALFDWFQSNFDTVQVATTDYQELLASDAVDAVYCAVPHNLHQQFYTDILKAGKHLFGEKPFGIDMAANEAILAAIKEHPDQIVACSSEFPYYPGTQRVIQMINENPFGKIVEVEAYFYHSSDMDPNKKINWKRMIEFNGEYGCMGDLGLHVCHVPLRAGWMPKTVHARLTNLMPERFNGQGEKVPCETWDNAIIDTMVEQDGHSFPMTLRTYRIGPGEMNTWVLKVTGLDASIEYSTKFPRTLKVMYYETGKEQAWQHVDIGYKSVYPTITGGIFEFGFTDSILQMWASFCDQLTNGRDGMQQPYYCATPEETHMHHRILTAALQSHKTQQTIALD